MTKSELLEIINEYEDNIEIKVEYVGCSVELEKFDCFKITDIECGGSYDAIFLQIG
jgi:hypothetical protein